MSERDDTSTERANKPLEVLRDGALRVAIFRNPGEHGDTYAMAPGRIYTDKETGEVREATSLAGSEPLRMAHLLTKGHERVNHFKQEAKRQTRPPAPDRKNDERER